MALNLDIELLKTFIAIIETGSFARAGDRVGRTQSAVSMQMKRLEDIVGFPLFMRAGRVNRLSCNGESLLDYARRITALNDEAIGLFLNHSVKGEVCLGIPDDYVDVLLPDILSRFTREYPGIRIRVECFPSEVLYEKTLSGFIDLSVLTLSAGMDDVRIIRTEPLVWASSLRHETHLWSPLRLALPHSRCAWREKALAAVESCGRDYEICYASANAAALNSVILSGLAVGVLPFISLHSGMRHLGFEDGFPPLYDFDIGLLRSSGASSEASLVLSDYIDEAFSSFPRVSVADSGHMRNGRVVA